MQPAPDPVLSHMDLIAHRAVALQKREADLAKLREKVYEVHRKVAVCFEEIHIGTIRDFDFDKGDLVLMRNMQIEKSLNRKMRPRYLGPLIVISRNKGGAYILCELDGSVLRHMIAAFRLVLYFARKIYRPTGGRTGYIITEIKGNGKSGENRWWGRQWRNMGIFGRRGRTGDPRR